MSERTTSASASESYESSEENELAQMSMQERIKMERKLRKKRNFKEETFESMPISQRADPHLAIKARKSRDMPIEMSSKTPIHDIQYKLSNERKKHRGRDPRFLKEEEGRHESKFLKDYAFVFEADEERLRKLETSMKHLKQVGNTQAVKEMQASRAELKNRLRRYEQRKMRMEMMKKWRAEEAEKVAQGKKPYYPKKREWKEMEQQALYDRLGDSGKAEKYVVQKRKKAFSKHFKFPKRRDAHQRD